MSAYEDKATELLRDAMVMFENIERNRNMPAFAQTQQQYVAMGKRIREFFRDVEQGAYRED